MSQTTELQSFGAPSELAHAAARDLIGLLRGVTARQESFSLALSGGRIAQAFYMSLVEQTRAAGALDLWSRVDFFWADERCVPPDHAESNYRGAVEWLLGPLGIGEGRVHRIRGEEEPERAARHANDELVRVRGSKAGLLDLVILGMGEDGHVASLFPGEGEGEELANPPWYRSVVAVKPPPQRVTLTYGALAAAVQVWVLASGQGKENALRKSLAGVETPLGRVRQRRGGVRIYSDVKLG